LYDGDRIGEEGGETEGKLVMDCWRGGGALLNPRPDFLAGRGEDVLGEFGTSPTGSCPELLFHDIDSLDSDFNVLTGVFVKSGDFVGCDKSEVGADDDDGDLRGVCCWSEGVCWSAERGREEIARGEGVDEGFGGGLSFVPPCPLGDEGRLDPVGLFGGLAGAADFGDASGKRGTTTRGEGVVGVFGGGDDDDESFFLTGALRVLDLNLILFFFFFFVEEVSLISIILPDWSSSSSPSSS